MTMTEEQPTTWTPTGEMEKKAWAIINLAKDLRASFYRL